LAGEHSAVSGLAGRYASALLELAEDKQQLDRVAADLRGLQQLVDDSEDLRRLLRSPLYGREQQAKAMAAILDKSGIGDLARRFVMIVTQNRRLFALPQMIASYLSELARRRGEVTAEVTAARPLSDAQQSKLTEQLRRSVGAKVQVDLKIDPTLIGGLIVRVGSRMVDSSLRTKLQKLQLAMKGVG
jgi:F-type H+-transporting ATPase subunit delta